MCSLNLIDLMRSINSDCMFVDPLAQKYGMAGAQTQVPYDPYSQATYSQPQPYSTNYGYVPLLDLYDIIAFLQ